MDGIAVRAADTVGASETTPVRLEAGAFEVVDTGDLILGDFDAVVMREEVHSTTAGGAREPPPRPTSTCARSGRT